MPDTRRSMAQATGELLGRQSLADTTLAGIVEHSGAARGSLYHFFPGGKDQLVLDAVEVVGQILDDRLRAGSPTTPVEVGELFLDAFRRLLRDDNASGCPLATVIVDAAPEPVHTRAAHWLAAWEAELATMYERVGSAGQRRATTAAHRNSRSRNRPDWREQVGEGGRAPPPPNRGVRP